MRKFFRISFFFLKNPDLIFTMIRVAIQVYFKVRWKIPNELQSNPSENQIDDSLSGKLTPKVGPDGLIQFEPSSEKSLPYGTTTEFTAYYPRTSSPGGSFDSSRWTSEKRSQ